MPKGLQVTDAWLVAQQSITHAEQNPVARFGWTTRAVLVHVRHPGLSISFGIDCSAIYDKIHNTTW